MSQILGYTGSFQMFGHGVLIIVHGSIGGFVICMKGCSTMRLLAGTA